MANIINNKEDSIIQRLYTIEKCIGEGTFSFVYRVRNKKNNRKYAMKKILFHDKVTDCMKEDCFTEIHLLQMVNHPNIVKLIYCELDQSEVDHTLYIVCQLASLGDLHNFIQNHIKKAKLIEERLVWKFTKELSSALKYLHSRWIMHRDVKPANIYLSEGMHVKLGDFGFGVSFSPGTIDVCASTVLGSPYYMSPERLLHQKYYFNCDIWSMGCVIYELLAMQSPFFVNKLDMESLITKVTSCDYAPVPSDEYSKELIEVMELCLNVDYKERPSSEVIFNIVSVHSHNYFSEHY